MGRTALLCALVGLACAPSAPPTSADPAKAAPEPAEPPKVAAPEAPPVALDAAALDEAARSCDGTAARRLLGNAAASDFAAMYETTDLKSARLIASFGTHRAFDADGKLVASGVKAFVDDVAAELEVAPPAWWIAHLSSGTRRSGAEPNAALLYDTGRTETGDRRGRFDAGPGQSRVRPGWSRTLVESHGKLAVDLSMARVTLGPLPDRPGQTIEVSRASAGTTLFVAEFDAATGGMRFPLRAVDATGAERWRTEICGPDRQSLEGVGHMTVQIVVYEDRVLVFSAESHGVALDVLSAETGARLVAWSSNLWTIG